MLSFVSIAPFSGPQMTEFQRHSFVRPLPLLTLFWFTYGLWLADIITCCIFYFLSILNTITHSHASEQKYVAVALAALCFRSGIKAARTLHHHRFLPLPSRRRQNRSLPSSLRSPSLSTCTFHGRILSIAAAAAMDGWSDGKGFLPSFLPSCLHLRAVRPLHLSSPMFPRHFISGWEIHQCFHCTKLWTKRSRSRSRRMEEMGEMHRRTKEAAALKAGGGRQSSSVLRRQYRPPIPISKFWKIVEIRLAEILREERERYTK